MMFWWRVPIHWIPSMKFWQDGDQFFSPAYCLTIRRKLSHERLILSLLIILPRQLSVGSSKLLDYFAQLRARMRMLSNLNKLSIEIGNVRIQLERHWEVEEGLEWFKVRSEKSSLAFEIEINIKLALLSFNWEIWQLDTSMISFQYCKTWNRVI